MSVFRCQFAACATRGPARYAPIALKRMGNLEDDRQAPRWKSLPIRCRQGMRGPSGQADLRQ